MLIVTWNLRCRAMSIVSLLVGQCGNQVGSEFFKIVFNDNYDDCNGRVSRSKDEFVNESMETFFSVKGEGIYGLTLRK